MRVFALWITWGFTFMGIPWKKEHKERDEERERERGMKRERERDGERERERAHI